MVWLAHTGPPVIWEFELQELVFLLILVQEGVVGVLVFPFQAGAWIHFPLRRLPLLRC